MATITTSLSEGESILSIATRTPGTSRSTLAETEHTSEYLTPNASVTGREPNTNPPHWLTDHRRVPPHRPPQVHRQWVEIGGPLPMRLFLWNMFSGCRLLQWAYAVPRLLGYHIYGPDAKFLYKVAGEW
ncbi:hypothetical protein BDV27DRAFT_161336 [Aspergillus caelatus]|uniref:Uncharacterized protein n=1 Tax=Aspergillus caelatus TaxID=61420 RepID=A0A5N6ZWY6_9EURO|nr:uncharacterized protein BDV27DRAFT_161336 [Aspergillus caelatus]KAE8360770.1 hypothetical protein BDV27DRAFT_161336 [Aspergillus caelatus]